jgi:chitodextrinase
MRGILISFLSFFYFSIANAQIEKTINVPYTTSASPTFQALLYLPSDYSTTTKSYPLLVFCHSASEAADGSSAGSGLAKIYNQATLGGPPYYIEHGGWPATFTNPVTGAQEQFIVVSPQSNSWSVNGDMLANIVNYLVTTYRVDVNRIHLTGPSAGGAATVEYAAHMNPNEDAPSLTKNVRKWKPADIVPMSETTDDATQTWGNIIVADSIPCWAFGDPRNDLRGGFAQDLVNVINKAKAGYARFTSFSTGHGPWNPFYIPTYTENFTWNTIKTNYSIYTWMLGNSRIAVPIVPVANAGTAQSVTLPTSQATLNGSGSTGTITSYAWTQVSGPSTATITSSSAVSPTITGLVQGTYVFKLTVTGGSTATVQVTVNPVPPPVAKAGSAQTITLPTNQVTLSGSTSTGTITSYNWTQLSGPANDTITTPATVGTKVTGMTAGVYVFQLSLNGAVSTATVQVTVIQPPLVAKTGAAQTITLPTNHVTLNGSTSTGFITSYAWSQLIGPASDTIVSPASASTSVNGMASGNYTFQLQVTDNTGAISTTTVNITVLSNTTYASPASSVTPLSQTVDAPSTSASATVNYVINGSSLSSIKWTKFKTPGQTLKTVVFMGSSTTAGVGSSTTDSSFVGRFKKYYTAQGIVSNVVNLSVSGYNPFNAMPNGYTAPSSVVAALGASVVAVDPTVNVTKALTFNPDVIVINFPNNGYDVLATTDIMNGLQTLYNFAAANAAQVYITTTQPREDFTAAKQTYLQVLRDSIFLRFGTHAIDFYNPIAIPGTTKRLYPSSADAIHDNDQGHRQLFNVVVGSNVFQNKISSPSVIANPGGASTSFTGLTAGTNLFQATVVDTHGQNTNAVATVIVNAPILPVANAGSAQTITLPISQVTLNGSASTGTITSYAWTQLSGPANDTITTPTTATTSVKGLVAGIYVFKLTLNGGDTSATVQVTVNTPPPPIVNAGSDQTITLPASQVTLNGSASSGTINSYTWAQLSGPSPASITNPASASTTVTGLTQGIYVFQLTLNGDSSATTRVTVNTPPPPIANAGPAQSISLPTDHLTLSGSASTGIITSWNWTELSGPDSAAVIVSPTSANTVVTGLVQGVYIFKLTLNGDSATVQVTVNPPPPPIANAGAAQILAFPASQATLNGSASSGFITSYYWTELSGPDSSAVIVSPTTISTAVTGLIPGVYIFQLTLNGDSISTVQVTVNAPPPPVANAGSNQSITLPLDHVILTATASTGLITSYHWTQLSGPDSVTLLSPTDDSTIVAGLTQGVYIFKLTLNGDSSTTVRVTVNPPPPPIANAGAAQILAFPASQATLNGSASSGFITSYNWTELSGPDSSALIASPTTVSTVVTGLIPGVYIFQLTLNGDSISTVQVTVNPPPPPIANAGPNQTITRPVNQVTLNAKRSTGFITSYNWAELSGPDSSATIVSPASDSTLVTGLVPGVYVFQLTLNGDSTTTTQVTVNQPTLIANAGPSQTISLPTNQVTLNGNASSGIITSYAWTQVSGPSVATITSPAIVGTTITGLIQGVYVYRLTVIDDLHTTKTDTLTVTVNNGIVTKMVNVNVYGGTNPYANTQWNNWNVNSNITSPTLTYSDATSSGITATLNINESVVDNSATYGGVMAPAAVLRYTSYCEVTRTLTLNNLKAAATYNIELYASRNSNAGQLSIFKVGTVADTVASYNNLTDKAVLTGLKPSSGKITITISTPTGYNYLNGFALTEQTTTTTGGAASSNSATSTPAVLANPIVNTNGLLIYPNPARDQFTLNLNNSHTGKMKITVVNQSGVTLRSLESAKEEVISSTSIPVNGLPAGTYFITIQIGNWRETRTILKL